MSERDVCKKCLEPTKSAPPMEDNPFRGGEWATWANLVKGVNPGPFLIMSSSWDMVLVVDPDYISSEEGQWQSSVLFQKYDPEKHLKAIIEYYAIAEGRAGRVL